jgi:uncharacterized membrane protein
MDSPGFLIFALVTLIVLLVFVYPWVQEQRERDLAKRLEQTRDPHQAIMEADRISALHRHEANFFRKLAKYVWPSLFH